MSTASKRMDLPDSDTELFQLSQFALLDSEEALKNCGDRDMVKELLQLMLQELAKDCALMQDAFQNQDFVLVEHTAHKIKGGALYIGTTRLKYACQYLERYWKSGERKLFGALYHQAMSVIDETLIYIEDWAYPIQIAQ